MLPRGSSRMARQRCPVSVCDCLSRCGRFCALMVSSVGLALNEQVLPDDQEIPTLDNDWRLDVLVMGDGSVIQRQIAREETDWEDEAQSPVENG